MSDLAYRECGDCEIPLWDREGERCANCVLDDQIKTARSVALLATVSLFVSSLVWIIER